MGMSIGMHMDMSIGMRIGMRKGMCMDMSIGMWLWHVPRVDDVLKTDGRLWFHRYRLYMDVCSPRRHVVVCML